MSKSFETHLEIAESYFNETLPYWCDNFSRPTDSEFADYLKKKGHNIHYRILELFDQVYIPINCDLDQVLATAKERKELRTKGVAENELPILL